MMCMSIDYELLYCTYFVFICSDNKLLQTIYLVYSGTPSIQALTTVIYISKQIQTNTDTNLGNINLPGIDNDGRVFATPGMFNLSATMATYRVIM